MSDDFDPTLEPEEPHDQSQGPKRRPGPNDEPVIGEPSLESLEDVGAVRRGGEIEGPEWVKGPADEPPLEPVRVPHPRERPASQGGWAYPGRKTPSGRVVFEGKRYPVVRNCSWTEEQYVAHEVAVTKSQLDAGTIRRTVTNLDTKKVFDDYASRLERCAEHARWRYRGFLAGEVEGL